MRQLEASGAIYRPELAARPALAWCIARTGKRRLPNQSSVSSWDIRSRQIPEDAAAVPLDWAG